MATDSHFVRFLKNNDSPSEAVLTEVKDLILKPIRELEKKQEEIEHLVRILDDLKVECNVVKKCITEYSIILSPIRRIPSDILHEIFYHCLPTHRNPVMSVTEAPLLLTRICHPWRSIALSSHRIWSKLHVSISPYPPAYHDGPWGPGTWSSTPSALVVGTQQNQDEHANVMRARIEHVGFWLSRSGSCPLSISIKAIDGFGVVLPEDVREDGPFIQVFNQIVPHLDRLRDFELSVPFGIYQVFQRMISLSMIPELRNIRAHFVQHTTPAPNERRDPVLLLHSPNLQRLSIYTDNEIAMLYDPKNIPPMWGNLTHLSFHFPITSADAVPVLRRCQNLYHCKLVISDGWDGHIIPEDILHLPRLRSLSVLVNGLDTETMIYRRIDAPALDSFEYQSFQRFPPDSVHNQVDPIPSPVLALLENVSNMRKLSFDPRLFSPQDILLSFRFVSNLTHLVVSRRARKRGPRNGGRAAFRTFNLDLLVIDQKSDGTLPGKEVLLPKLELFEAFLAATVTDEILLRFILSRLSDPKNNQVSSLKTVKVTFERSMQKDIREEIYRHAEAVGVEITLDLFYFTPLLPPSNSKYTDFLSPWYGLSEPLHGFPDSDRSWLHADIDTNDF
ncbi:hypothetical protein GALMADRAFT_238930 [Galerina marginata CBS 339.88]|uniref:F-box domain-containing protein n=1 Tax=Galerina marginata (strain CBS 339.88) TaxID=685588 RepID=A0A067TIY3_GALM3|nr:hypothetical protein GALMADRAFT_238930 [Galerina marginata CBS 339.88]